MEEDKVLTLTLKGYLMGFMQAAKRNPSSSFLDDSAALDKMLDDPLFRGCLLDWALERKWILAFESEVRP